MKIFYIVKHVIGYILLITIFTVINTFAGNTGKIAGKIIDKSNNRPLIGVNVLIMGTTMGAAADLNGEYYILNIPPGTYEVKASLIGYQSVIVKNVKVSADQTTQLDFKLGVQAVQLKSIVITASKPIVQKDLTSTQQNISGNAIKLLPVENVKSVINLQAGVVNGHFRGGRLGEVKYMIDGVAVNDVYSGQQTMEANINSIQELQVITGTFNAEYGQALSGVVNQITKIPSNHYSGSFSTYAGDYVTSRTNLYPFMGGLHPLRTHDIQGTLSGPIPLTNGFVKFFSSVRYLSDNGYLYSKRIFDPQDSSNFNANNPKNWYRGATGDGADVPMNYSRTLTLQGKLNFKVGTGRGIVLEGLYQKRNYKNYDHLFRFDPDGDYKNFQNSFLGSIKYTHVFSQSAFLNVQASLYSTDYHQYVYKNPLDPRYVSPDKFRQVSGNSFYTAGTQNWHFSHNTKTYTAKIDFTDQLTNVHEMKTGFEFEYYSLDYKDFQVMVLPHNNYKPSLPQPGAFNYNIFHNNPYQFAFYIQDKIELNYLIVNLGIRFDYFQPDGQVLRDPNNIAELDPLQPPYPSKYFVKASEKKQISPRIGISYPISDKGALHISYGHFFQIPPFEYLYKNPNFRIPLTGNFPQFIGNSIGNANLKPQETTMYEIGLQQELFTNFGIDITAYYKDIRNLLGVAIHIKNNFRKFAEYINRDYGAVRGITVSLNKRFSNGIGATINYTYQVAQGNASNPNEAFNKAQSSPPIEVNKQLVPLNWDRRHSLNFTITLGVPDNYIISAVGQLGSGLPYTPSFQNQRTGLENSANKPAFFNVDLYITKYLKLSGLNFSLFAKIYNLFDTPNEINVFTDTGRAGYTLEETRAQSRPRGINTLKEFFTRPDFYSAPRQILLGLSLNF